MSHHGNGRREGKGEGFRFPPSVYAIVVESGIPYPPHHDSYELMVMRNGEDDSTINDSRQFQSLLTPLDSKIYLISLSPPPPPPAFKGSSPFLSVPFAFPSTQPNPTQPNPRTNERTHRRHPPSPPLFCSLLSFFVIVISVFLLLLCWFSRHHIQTLLLGVSTQSIFFLLSFFYNS